MKLWHWALAGIFVATFVGISILSAKQESRTYDEIVYTQEGSAIFSRGNFSIDPYNPPFIKEILHFGGRPTTIVLGALLLVSVFLAAKSYFGIPQALFALFLLSLEPNVLGNSHYVTLDAGFTLFFFLAYIFFLGWIKRRSTVKSLLLGFALGAVLASKITAIPYFFLSIIPYRKMMILPFVIAIMVIWGAYFFTTDVIVVKHDNPNRVSSKIISYAKNRNALPLAWVMERLQNQKVPLGTYLSVVKNNVIRGRNAPWPEPWYGMWLNILLKTPIPLMIFFVLGMRKRNIQFFIPIVIILVTSVVSRMNPFVRYVLPMYPFVVLIAASSLKEFRGIYRNLLFLGLIIWYAAGTANQFPHFISYANELAGPREKRYEKFVDSNIDWGQGLPDLQKYIAKKQPRKLVFSYFGRDNGDAYGFISDRAWGGYKFEEICAFHTIDYHKNSSPALTAISVSNWYGCGYSKGKTYNKANIADVVGDSILIFTY